MGNVICQGLHGMCVCHGTQVKFKGYFSFIFATFALVLGHKHGHQACIVSTFTYLNHLIDPDFV